MYTKEHSANTNRARSPARLAVIIFVVAAGVVLILEHRAHVLGYWLLLLLAACIGSHFFMRRGHGKGGSHGSEAVPAFIPRWARRPGVRPDHG